MLVSVCVNVKVCCPVDAEVKLVADFCMALLVSSAGSELALTVKYAVPPVRLIGVEPSASRNVKLICLVSPLITLEITLPNFAIVLLYSPPSEALAEADGLREAEGETDVDGLSEADAELEGEREALGETEALGEILVEADGDTDADGLLLALGEYEGEALPPRLADSRYESLVIGFQIAVNFIRPAVIVFEETVAIIF
jgi:hypothetical protein